MSAAQIQLTGRIVEIGDLDTLNGEPGVVVSVPRAQLFAQGRNMAFQDVVLTLAPAAPTDPPRNDDAERERAATDKWRLETMSEAERAYYNAPRGRP